MQRIDVRSTTSRVIARTCTSAFLFLNFFGGSAATSAVIDQDSFVSPSDELFSPRINFTGGETLSFGQTFVAGVSGRITRVELQLKGYATPTNTRVSLVDGSPVSGTNFFVGSGYISRFDIPNYYYGPPKQSYIDLSSQNISIVSGHTYSLLLEAEPEPYPQYPFGYVGWGYGISSGLTPFTGIAVTKSNLGNWTQYSAPQSNNGFGFRTYVDAQAAPEPRAWAMMVVGFGIVGVGLRRRRKPSVRVTYA